MKYKGYETPEWSREHLLLRDGCRDSIREFWSRTGKQPNKKYYPDPEGKHRCTICGKPYKRAQDLKAHRTRMKHHEAQRVKVTDTAKVDAIQQKRKAMQNLLPKVKWEDTEADNTWQFAYLGSIFEAGGGDMPDVRRRIAMATQRFGKLRHIWKDGNLHLNLRMRLYKACVCSILTYGSEAWKITAAVAAALNGSNSKMVSIITGKTVHDEASTGKTFDVVKWIRARRLQWLGHILRLGTERQIKHAAYAMYKDPTPGDLLMDAPKTSSWHELLEYAKDREYWRTRVRAMKQPKVRVQLGSHVVEGACAPFTIST